jgi:hypothetical protein
MPTISLKLFLIWLASGSRAGSSWLVIALSFSSRLDRSTATMYSGLLVLRMLGPPEQMGDGAPRRGSDGVCGRSKECEATVD